MAESADMGYLQGDLGHTGMDRTEGQGMTDYTELIADLRDADQANWKRLSLDAANAIEALQAEVGILKVSGREAYFEGLAAQPHWVSVEQPPKKHGKYLVCYVEKGEFYWEEAHYCFYQDGDKWTAWSSYQDDDVEITPDYWMPIEPPKEDA